MEQQKNVKEKKIEKILFVTIVITPLLIGGLTYILFRSKSLVMFKWFYTLGLTDAIEKTRLHFSIIRLPKWLIYNLPDALWLYSFSNILAFIWKNKLTKHSIIWLIIAPAAGIFSELGQALNLIPGTYDSTDLLFLITATIIFIFQLKISTCQKNISPNT